MHFYFAVRVELEKTTCARICKTINCETCSRMVKLRYLRQL